MASASNLPKLEFSPALWWESKRMGPGKVGPALTHPSVLPSTDTLLKLLLFLLPFARFGFLFSLKGLYFSSFPPCTVSSE